MDMDRAMEFILEQQAKFAAQAAELEADMVRWQAESKERFEAFNKRADRVDRQIRGLLKLAKIGARALERDEQRIKRLEELSNLTEIRFQEFLRRTDPRTNTN
jgi:hypothetical protein